jgi:SH3-like domain-containing protein
VPKRALRFALGALALATLTSLASPSSIANEAATATDAKARKGSVTGLPIPRYVSLKSAKVNVRRGPGKDYPVEWVFAKRGLPVEIIAEYDRWRKVRDHEGDMGWVWHSMLDGRRSAIVLKPASGTSLPTIHEEAEAGSPVIAYAEPGVIAEVQSCNSKWCRVKVDGYRGWSERATLWGVYAGETIE